MIAVAPDAGPAIAALADAWDRVRSRMDKAARRAGRSPEEVRLVAVTKGQPLAQVRAAYQTGMRDFGENRVEEGQAKVAQMGTAADVTWHMIGRIQGRKAPRVANSFSVVHSVDRERIARLLDRATGGERPLEVYLECNLSGEGQKAGWPAEDQRSWDRLVEGWAPLLELPGLRWVGLMTMAPWGAPEPVVRGVFSGLRRLAEYAGGRLPGLGGGLSMGMTDDFETAIEEGATVIRVGRAIFGDPSLRPAG
jgi:pyridoxal phosphate enzyme (YggS family)